MFKIILRRVVVPLLALSSLNASNVLAHEFSAELTPYFRYYPQDANDPRQHGNIFLATFLAEYYHDWDDGNQRFAFTPYLRVYDLEEERSDFDIQELYWRKSFESSELSVGVRKYFWGKTESAHLVDIINQVDSVQDIDTEDRLGQPVIDYTWISGVGDFSVLVMPYFRERRFPDVHGRGRFPLVVDTAHPVYESAAEETHTDFALRWTHYVGVWDLGLSYFDGTGRDPRLEPGFNNNGELVLIPHYDQIQQFGADIQATTGAWLWKFEGLVREQRGQQYTAVATGFEYTLYGVGGGATDVGLLTEVLFDDRGDRATTPFESDLFIGARLAFNDVQSTELLAGVVHDPDDKARFILVEGSRRIGDTWKMTVEARFFSNIPPGNLLEGVANDDYVEFSITKFF